MKPSLAPLVLLTVGWASASADLLRVGHTPALGWLSWQHYRCNRNCKTDPENCLSEKLIKRTADLMVSEGYAAAGYEYVNIDDCWQAPSRVNGHVVSDPDNFPSGIKALADYVHSKGLKLGIYTALGNGTCAMGGVSGLPRGTGKNLGLGCDSGSLPDCAVAERDINDFVSWGIDALKVDGCFEHEADVDNRSYARVGQLLRAATAKTGRAVLYHPSNLGFHYPRQLREYQAIGAHQWRWFDDVVWCI